jgi:hypothetical protein
MHPGSDCNHCDQIRNRLEPAEAAQHLGYPEQSGDRQHGTRQVSGEAAQLRHEPLPDRAGPEPGKADEKEQLDNAQQIAPRPEH